MMFSTRRVSPMYAVGVSIGIVFGVATTSADPTTGIIAGTMALSLEPYVNRWRKL
jgi:hypothetical protein